MKYAIVYSSKTGNTKMLADVIQQTLVEKDIIYFGQPDQKALQADQIYIGFWTDKGRCNDEIVDFLKTVENKNVFLYGTAGFGQDPAYFEKIIEKTKEYLKDSNVLIGTYMCQGKMPMSVRARYEKMPHIPNIKKLIENFDQALSHPNEEDLQKLKEKIVL